MSADASQSSSPLATSVDVHQLRLLQSRIELLTNDLTKASERLAVISAHVTLLCANAQALR
jgi:hypothetical protein